MAIRIVKGYRTISNEAACLLAGVAPIYLRAEELVKLNMIKRGSGTKGNIYPDRLEKSVNYKQWIHPALLVDVKEETDPEVEFEIEIYTDGSKCNMRVGCAFVAYHTDEIVTENKYRLSDCCINNQAAACSAQGYTVVCKHYLILMWHVTLIPELQSS